MVLSLPLILSFVRLRSRRLKRLSQHRQRVKTRPQEESEPARKRGLSQKTTFWMRPRGGVGVGDISQAESEDTPSDPSMAETNIGDQPGDDEAAQGEYTNE